jgi:uncharacterized protein (DUF1330 family)
MKNWKLWMAVVVGIAIGFVGSNAIRAQQTKPVPGYVVGELDITDPVAYQQYAAKSPAIVAAHGGEYLIRGGSKVTPLEGEPPKRFVVIQYESVEKALEWYNSPDYAAIRPIREKSAKSRVFIVEGVAK